MSAMENMGMGENKDAQLHLNLKSNENNEDAKKAILDDIKKRYPNANLRPDLVTKGMDGKWLFNGRDLEEAAKMMHMAYSPDENEDWTNN